MNPTATPPTAPFSRVIRRIFHDLTFKKLLSILVGTAIASFGLYNIHQRTGITEGGILGTILLIHHWFGISPSIATPVLDFCFYGLAFRFLGGNFLKMAILSTLSFSGFFRLWELFPPILPDFRCLPCHGFNRFASVPVLHFMEKDCLFPGHCNHLLLAH